MSSTASQLVIALDIGTSSTRALVFDTRGRKIGEAAQIPYEQHTTPDGGVEIDADFLLEKTAECLDKLLENLEGEVVGVAMSCFWHSLLAVDEAGKALTPVFSWADNRAAPWIALLRAQLDEPKCQARLGCVFHTSYWPAKLLWLRDARLELFDCDAKPHWMGFGEFLLGQWCGTPKMSLSMASGTGLFDQNQCQWDEEILAHLPLQREQLPPLCDLDEPFELNDELKKRWPKLANVRFFPALGDGACSNIGSGCADETKIGLNAGTSGALRVVLKDFDGAPPRGLWRYRIDKNRSIVGGALSNAGNILAWTRETFHLPPDWDKEVAVMNPDEHGLTILPFLAGERAPLWNGSARFVLEGASLSSTPVLMVRAILEGAALRFAAIANELLKLAPQAQIVFSGGALDKVPVWQPIVCDAIGAPLLQGRESEASARGAALLALEALGLIKDVTKMPFERGEELQPNPDHHEIYIRALERQNALYDKVYRTTN